ncbi:HBR402Wp [Eremothecium sinecaudum]|uniref:HBR402Wp n=1 Tax=Eremothecium sinecaudum TaxID=45286 RepID=A0A109UXF3_9SACH|nr:HBR402Wp [Eremothecium sinecaudum]AMD19303.1 HBR402Wp [Eremothecium sinecaudum]
MSATEAPQVAQPDEEELLLAKLVFGDKSDFYEGIQNVDLGLSSEGEPDGNNSDDESGEEESDDAIDRMQDDQLFFVDEGDDEDKMEIDEEEKEEEVSAYEDDSSDAWNDSDDERLIVPITESNRSKKLRSSYEEKEVDSRQYVRRLRLQFEKIYPRPKWVDEVDESGEDDGISDEDNDSEVINGDINALHKILQSTYSYSATSSRLLAPKRLDITRLTDANVSHPSKSAVQSLSFHPLKPLLLTGGYDRTLRIYHIDGKNNHLVSSVYLTGTPVQTCKFYVNPSHSEQMVFSGGRRRYMHSWNISSPNSQVASIEKISRMYGHEETQRSFEKFKLGHLSTVQDTVHGIILLQGNNGWINVLHASTGVWLMGCKIEGVMADFCIDYHPLHDGKFKTILIVVNKYGEVWEFDLTNNGKVLRKWQDAGGVSITTIQVGGGTNSSNLLPFKSIKRNRWLAIGSESGFVNVYDRQSQAGKPVATLSQLTTTISTLEFSSDGQILCMASRAVKDALRLVHLPSATVFSNWPTSGTPLGSVTSVAFSAHSEMLAVGNEQGKVRLWRLNHY